MSTFFDHQEQSLRRSRLAATGFALSTLVVVLVVTLVTSLTLRTLHVSSTIPLVIRPATSVLIALGITALMIGIPAHNRRVRLRQNADTVLRMLGARPLEGEDVDGQEAVLRNIVEEMSIASGVPLPRVFLLDESGINAFSLGWDFEHAILVVTRGAVERLTRDELQGVVAHEFSHILYGDMALNTRMLVWLAGLFGVYQTGCLLIYGGADAGGMGGGRASTPSGLGRSPGGGGGGNLLPLMVLGFSLMAAGSLGMLLGKLLQAAVSREREFLADASSVQFTRNPGGLGGALKKLGANGVRGRLAHPGYLDFSHMFFADTRVHSFSRALATHPPLVARILRVDPTWDGTYPKVKRVKTKLAAHVYTGNHPVPPLRRARELYEHVGTPTPEMLETMHEWLENLPAAVVRMSRTRLGSAAITLRLLLQEDPEIRAHQMDAIRKHCDGELFGKVEETLQRLPKLSEGDLFPLLDLCAPHLQKMHAPDRAAFTQAMEAVIRADNRLNLIEYAIRRRVERALMSPAEHRQQHFPRTTIGEVENEVNLLLSLLAWLGADNEDEARASFDTARDRMLGFHGGIRFEMQPRDVCTLQSLDKACKALAKLTPGVQKRLIRACEAAIAVNGRIRTTELLAYRATATALDVPVCPVLMVNQTT